MSGFWNSILRFFGIKSDESESGHHHRHHHHHEDKQEKENEQEDVHINRTQRQARKQIEFYFSPANLERDAFMKQLIDSGDDRYVPIDKFFDFNKISELGLSLEDLVEALSTSHKLEINSERTHVRSIKPFKPDPRIDYKTICIDGIDRDDTRENLEELLKKQFGTVNYLLMRNVKDKQTKKNKFCGKIEVILSSETRAKNASETGFAYKEGHLPVKILGYLNERNENETPKKEKGSAKKDSHRSKPKATD